MSSHEALKEETEAVTSIYNAEVLTIDDFSLDSVTAILALSDVAYTFTLIFPPSYPDEPPSITGTHHVAASAKKGEGETAADLLREVLGRTFIPGQVCLFDLIEEATPLLTEHHEAHNGTTQDLQEHIPVRSARPYTPQDFDSPSDALTAATSIAAAANIPPPNWTMSEPLVVNKSTFVARCVSISSLPDATTSISHLLSTNKKVAAATHNITAWRIKQVQRQANESKHHTPTSDAPEIIIQDFDDDGESAAGGRLLHLMQLMDVWNVVVVVTRWYGGVKLGPDRFRCINDVAREALVSGGFVKERKETGKGAGKKGKR